MRGPQRTAGAHTLVLAGLLAGLAPCSPNRAGQPPRGPAAGVAEVADTSSPKGVEAEAMSAQPDTLRGVVAIVGAEPLTMVVLRPAAGREVVLEGEALPELRRLAGVEVQVEGAARDREGGQRRFVVERFAVRAVDGVPAVDGILIVAGDVAHLRLASGAELRIARLPTALRGYNGARVWLSGRLEGDVEAFGVIHEAGAGGR